MCPWESFFGVKTDRSCNAVCGKRQSIRMSHPMIDFENGSIIKLSRAKDTGPAKDVQALLVPGTCGRLTYITHIPTDTEIPVIGSSVPLGSIQKSPHAGSDAPAPPRETVHPTVRSPVFPAGDYCPPHNPVQHPSGPHFSVP